MYHLQGDGSVTDSEGRFVHVSPGRFKSWVRSGKNCIICGRTSEQVPFNDEHVLPQWILRNLDLSGKEIVLSNQTRIDYAHYRIPCCRECNTLMGARLEEPVRVLFEGGHQKTSQHLKEKGPWLLIVWLALIYIKTYYKDMFLRLHRDKRKPGVLIGDLYEWEYLHHTYCVARAFYSGAVLHRNAMNSFLVVPAKMFDGIEPFDYCTLYDYQASLFRYKQIAILAVQNDGCACQTMIRDYIRKIRGELSPTQLRELLARLAYSNHILKTRPRFGSDINLAEERITITAERESKFTSGGGSDQEFGLLLYFLCRNLMQSHPEESRSQIEENLKSGRWGFLLDEHGNFRKSE